MKKMTRRESILTLAAAFAAGGSALKAVAQSTAGSAKAPAASSAAATGTGQRSQVAQPSAADQAFLKFVDQYFDGFFQFDPARATKAGIHKYDNELPDYTHGDIKREIARSQKALTTLAKISNGNLAAVNQFDSTLLQSLINGHVLDLQDIQMWAKDPNFYNRRISSSLFPLIERDFAPIDQRVKSLIARERQIPGILSNAEANVVNPPAVYTRVAIQEVQAQLNYLQNTLPQAVAGAESAALKTEFANINQDAISAYQQFLNYLQTRLSSESQGSYAIGTKNFQKKLLYDEMIDTPPADLVKIGHDEMIRVQSLFTQAANILDSTKTPIQVFQSVQQSGPAAGQVIGTAQSDLGDVRQFVVSHELVTVPPAPIPEATEMPAFRRALTVALLNAPGPFEQHSIQAFLYVTLPGLTWDKQRTKQLLQFLNFYELRIMAIREGYPGHYVQMLWLKQAPSRARELEPYLRPTGTNSEGWPHYCEEMMLEQGYGEGNPSLLMVQLQASLIRLCRYIASIKMHTQRMTVTQAATMFQEQAYMDPDNAQREAERAAFNPTGLAYTLGKLEILKLRSDYKEKVGDKFSLKSFHDQFLSYGIAPVKMIREQMLQDQTPVI